MIVAHFSSSHENVRHTPSRNLGLLLQVCSANFHCLLQGCKALHKSGCQGQACAALSYMRGTPKEAASANRQCLRAGSRQLIACTNQSHRSPGEPFGATRYPGTMTRTFSNHPVYSKADTWAHTSRNRAPAKHTCWMCTRARSGLRRSASTWLRSACPTARASDGVSAGAQAPLSAARAAPSTAGPAPSFARRSSTPAHTTCNVRAKLVATIHVSYL